MAGGTDAIRFPERPGGVHAELAVCVLITFGSVAIVGGGPVRRVDLSRPERGYRDSRTGWIRARDQCSQRTARAGVSSCRVPVTAAADARTRRDCGPASATCR